MLEKVHAESKELTCDLLVEGRRIHERRRCAQSRVWQILIGPVLRCTVCDRAQEEELRTQQIDRNEKLVWTRLWFLFMTINDDYE